MGRLCGAALLLRLAAGRDLLLRAEDGSAPSGCPRPPVASGGWVRHGVVLAGRWLRSVPPVRAGLLRSTEV